jgi:hypothetical protein
MRFCLGAVAIRRDYKRSTGAKDTELPHDAELEAAITATEPLIPKRVGDGTDRAHRFVEWCNTNIWG